MKIHRFFIDIVPDTAETAFTLGAPQVVRQINSVLKIGLEERIEVCDGKGRSAILQIKKIEKNSILAHVLSVSNQTESVRPVTAFVAVLKNDHFALVVQKLTELGIAEIIPLITARTIKIGCNMSRLTAIAREAAELSGRVTIPKIHEPQPFKTAAAAVGAQAYFFDVTKEKQRKPKTIPTSFFVGPEGGWSPEEISHAHACGLISRQLGPLILRGETAAIVGAYVTINE